MNRQKFTILDSRGQSAEDEEDDLGLSFSAAKTIDEFEERFRVVANTR